MEILDSAANSIEAAFVISTGIAKWRFLLSRWNLPFSIMEKNERNEWSEYFVYWNFAREKCKLNERRSSKERLKVLYYRIRNDTDIVTFRLVKWKSRKS